MSNGAKPKRLFKVAQEFNVATQTIVEALAKHEFKVDNKPNAKITPEMYAALESLYSTDKARHQELGQAREKKESAASRSVSVDSLLTPEEPKLDPLPPKPAEPKPAPTPEPQLKPQEPKLQPEPAKQEPTPTPEPVQEEEKPAAKEVMPEPKSEPKPAEVKTEAVPAKDQTGEKADATEDSAPKPEITAEAEGKAVAEVPSVDKTDSEDGPKTPAKETPKAKEDVKADTDTDTVDEAESEEETIRARDKNRLKGTKVLGTINVGTDKADDDGSTRKRRKKRKRVKAEQQTEDTPQPKKRPKATTPADDTADTSAKRKKKRTRKKAVTPEISEKEAEKKVRETMAAVQGGKGKQRQKRRREKRDQMAEKRELEAMMQEEQQAVIEVTEYITVSDLAQLFDISPTQVITSCMNMGLMVSINQRLESETIELIADEYEKEIRFVDADAVAEEIFEEEEDAEEDLRPRAPIVTVMGHVDHGKTSLLDFIKKSKVAEGEAGGITQHIGAYAVVLDDDRKITFLDTPGHEAFTAMRARGAQVTDIVILVVAADDSVMPQTIEAINHAQAAGVSLVVALNKVDKEGANTDKIMQQLSEHNVLVEDYGGSVQCAKVSAKTGQGIDELLEKVLIEAELLELKANPDRNATGIVLETKLDRGKGVVANVLILKGKLNVGDTFVAGNHYGRVRAMENERGQRIETAGPATPIQLTGFDGQPQAGDKFNVTDEEKTAKNIALKRQQIKREQELRKVKHMSLDEFARRMSAGSVSELNIIIKGDVDGSIEALSGALQKLSTDEVIVNIIHTGVGAISETDVLLATASNAIIIGFQVRPTANARKLAEKEEIDVRLFSIIYEAVDLVRDALEGMLSPDISEKITASVDVRDTFKVPGVGTIAGCYVTEGKITRNTRVRLIREGIVIFTGEISSLKRFKDDAREVSAGYECGIGIKNFNDIKVGDVIEGYEMVETKRTLDTAN
ncbi:bacterial translation initiation factor 2 (bIF-2) [Cyclonatronum proteinivorum]|uniref:Translation initiation factor IF-2 n=1 Tax=Cyclonatronum proteinivorum TaxID=1457365 RepID=A0A345UKD8_9BACT|nr:translation initiation factor IF-2 [Cyclonatronum proteinivorum]AXJ00940.1 bacterial translation initiation factor 2 (bIF-2) [Cyclonatronum proteinivorum]